MTMNVVRILFFVSLCLALGALAMGFIQDGNVRNVWLVIILGALWLLGHYRQMRWVTDAAFSVLFLVVIMAALYKLSAVWLLLAVIAGLLAWDTDHFITCMMQAEDVLAESLLVRQHSVRLALVLVLGGIFAWIGLRVHIKLNFIVALLLSLLAVIGLSGVVAALRRNSAE